MYAPKRSNWRKPNGKGSVALDTTHLLFAMFLIGLYAIFKYVAGWQWMDRVAVVLWQQISPIWSLG